MLFDNKKMNSAYFLIMTILLISNESYAQEKETKLNLDNCYLPDGCHYIKYSKTYEYISLNCRNYLDRFDMRGLDRSDRIRCSLFSIPFLYLNIRSKNTNQIVDNAFQLFKFGRYLNKTYKKNFKFLDVKGFDAKSVINIENTPADIFFYGNFRFYDRATMRQINSCDDFIGIKYDEFIFKQRFYLSIYLSKPENKQTICTLLFNKAVINDFELNYVIKTFYKQNTIEFVSPRNATMRINSYIESLHLENIYELEIDSKLVNYEIFNAISYIYLYGRIKFLQPDLFKPFKMISTISLEDVSFIDLVRRQGIEWIRNLNSHIHVNLSDSSTLKSIFFRSFLKISLVHEKQDNFINKPIEYFSDQDFCILKDYPFDQLVVILPIEIEQYDNTSSETFRLRCSDLWLFQYHMIFDQMGLSIPQFASEFLNQTNFNRCDFESILKLCNKQTYKIPSTSGIYFTDLDYMTLFELLTMIFSSIISVFGLFFNILVVYVLLNKKNKKLLTENKHYNYVVANCISNCFVLAIQIFGLINECQYPFGIYCSSIYATLFAQYFKLVVGEFFNCMFRLISSFSYVTFSLGRLSRIGKDNNKFVQFFSDLSPKIFIVFTVIISTVLSVVKPIRFDINLDEPNLAYPMLFDQNIHRIGWQKRHGFQALLYLNIIYDLVNYCLFVLVNLIIDIVLLRELFKVINEREEKFNNDHLLTSQSAREKFYKENEEAKRRTIKMVIFNSLINFVKIPLAITTLNDLRIFILHPYSKKNYNDTTHLFWKTLSISMSDFCSLEKSCLLFQRFGNFLYLISLSLNFFFFKYFDKNFQLAYKQAFNQKPSNQNSNNIK